MRSLSEVLIKRREEKSLTISQVSYETNISKKYIQALEEEDFDVFPAEAYLLGFLRNYAEFLELEYDNIYAEYKNCLLREEPTPLSELMGVKKSFILKPWMIIAPLVVLALTLSIPPIIRGIKSQIDKRKEALRLAGENTSKNFLINDDFSGKKVKEGDSLVLDIGDNKLSYFIQGVSSSVTILETYKESEKILTLKLGNEVQATFKSDDGKEVLVTLFLKDVGGFSDNSAIVKVKREIKDPALYSDIIEEDPSVEVVEGQSKEKADSQVVLIRKRSTEPYSVSIKFEGDILFRSQQKGQELKENFYRKNSVLNMDVTRSIQIWTSNAGLTKFKINGKSLVLGKTGSVHVFTLRWIYYKDKDEYRLEYQATY